MKTDTKLSTRNELIERINKETVKSRNTNNPRS